MKSKDHETWLRKIKQNKMNCIMTCIRNIGLEEGSNEMTDRRGLSNTVVGED